MFDERHYVQCFDLKNPADVAALVAAYDYELGNPELAASEVESVIISLKQEDAFDSDHIWYAGYDVDKPTNPVSIQTLNVYSLIGERFYENEIQVYIETGTGNVYCKPDSVY
jgi:hypothetical protein